MTFREIFISAEAITKRRIEEMKFKARVMGAEIKDDENDETVEIDDLPDEAFDNFEKIAEQALKERGYGRSNN